MSDQRAELRIPGGRHFALIVGDLLEEPVDGIVNAANGHLAHGGGVAAVIARAAGHALDEEGRAHVAMHGPVPVGEAVVTTAGALPYRGVIHAVGPRSGDGNEEEALGRAVESALSRAHEQGWRSVSLPAISSGIFAVPHEICARAYVGGVLGFFEKHPDAALSEVRLCLRPGPLVEVVAGQMEEAGKGPTAD